MKEKKKIEELGYCRECLNQRLHLNLKREHVIIQYYPAECNCCKKTKNIVHKVKAGSRWRTWFSKKS